MRKYQDYDRLNWNDLLHYFEEEAIEDNGVDTIKTEDNKDDTPTEKSSKTTDFSSLKKDCNTPSNTQQKVNNDPKKQPSYSSSSITMDIQKEVKKQVDKIKDDLQKNDKSVQSNKKTSSVSDGIFKLKKSNKKKSNTPVKNNITKSKSNVLNSYLSPLNIQQNRYKEMVKFNSKEVIYLLNRLPQFSVIFSLCSGDRTTFGSKDLTEMFIKELISLDYSYFPVYLLDGNKRIRNIFLIVFNVPMRTEQPKRTFSKMVDYIKKMSSYYKINIFYTYENGNFYLYQNQNKFLTDITDYTTLMNEYSKNSGIQIKHSQLIVNPKPTGTYDKNYRTNRNELLLSQNFNKNIQS